MKKLLVILCALFALTVSAQSAEDLAASNKRIAELQKLIEKQPKACGFADIDAYASAIADAAKLAIVNSENLNSVNAALEKGETPALDQVTALGAGVKKEGELVKEAMGKAAPATAALKDVVKNPLKAKGAKSVMDFANKASEILTAESVAQVKMVSELTAKLKK